MAQRKVIPELMGENDVVDLLIRQHEMIRELFDEVAAAPPGLRADAFQRLARLMAVHETAEEEIVHPYARHKLADGGLVVDARLAEEREAKWLLARMEAEGPDAPSFERNLEGLRNAVLAHARNEEQEEFAELRARTSRAERRAMAAAVKAAEAVAPTHPHPGVESMMMNVLVGPTAALVDRTRDVIRKVLGGRY